MTDAAPLTHGKVWRLTLPIVLSNITLPLMGAVDTAVMGHQPDPAYIGGVALGALFFTYIYWGLGFLRMATTGFVAQARGAGDAQELRHIVLRGALIALALGALILALQGVLATAALSLLDGTPKVKALARDYIAVRIWGAPLALLWLLSLGWLYGMQRMRGVLVLALSQNALNAALALLFVIGFGWGIAGVAAATLIAEAGAGLLGVAMIWRGHRGAAGQWRAPGLFDAGKLLGMLRVNRDIFLRTLCLITAMGWFTSRGAGQGDVTLAANAVLLHFMLVAAYGLDAFAHTAEALTGAAIGARRRAEFDRAVKLTTLWAGGLALAFAAIYAAGGTALIGLLTGIEAVRTEAARFLPYAVLLPILSVWCFQFDGLYVAATRSAEMRNSMALALAGFLALGHALIPAFGNHGLWIAFCAFFVLRAAFQALWYPRILRLFAAPA